jgi:hypothetical protein
VSKAEQTNADRGLDALVAEKVLGYRRYPVPPDYDGQNGGHDVLVPRGFDHHRYTWPPYGSIPFTFFVPKYSSDIAEAWGVFESLTRRGWLALVKYDPERERNRWTCWVSWPTPGDPISSYDAAQAATDSPALSICLAAVRAVEAQSPAGSGGQ